MKGCGGEGRRGMKMRIQKEKCKEERKGGKTNEKD